MKNNNHASKALAVVLSGALAFAPAANAAVDENNMAYDSAAEGFYGSLRVQYANNDAGGDVDNDSAIEAEGSRLGVRGDIDLGGGLEAFYGFEWNLGGPADGDTALKTRQNHVGLKGDWGSIWLGAFDSVIVRFGGFATTDILDQYSGNFEPIYRTSNAVAYISPDLNGFQFGIEAQANDGKKGATTEPVLVIANAAGTPVAACEPFFGANGTQNDGDKDFEPAMLNSSGGCDGNTRSVSGDEDDGNDFDRIGIGANYSIQGLTFSGAYYQQSDALVYGIDEGITATTDEGVDEEKFRARADNLIANKPPLSNGRTDDKGQYALGISYSQDNWIVAAMYGGEDITITECGDEVDLVIPGVGTRPGAGTQNNECDFLESRGGDATFFSFAGGVSIDKLEIHGLWEQKTYEDAYQIDTEVTAQGGIQSVDRDETIVAIAARYHLGSKARLRAAWRNKEVEADGGFSEDTTNYALGMRVDF